MTWLGWALRRARASTGLLLTLLALVTVTTGIISGTIGYSQAAATTAARGALTSGEPTEAGVQVQTRLADDPHTQDSLAQAQITDIFAPAPVTITRTVVSEPRPVSAQSTADPDASVEGRVVLYGSESLTTDNPEFADQVDVLEGSWPGAPADDGPIPGALHASTAQGWGVGVGETLTVADRQVEITALWAPVDAQDPFWFADELVRLGEVGNEHGPLVVDEASLPDLGGAPFVRWTIRPDADTIQPDDLAGLVHAADNVRNSLRADGVSVRGITIEGDLAPTAAAADHNLQTARALGLVPLSVLVLVTGLAVIQLARLLAATRAPQVLLLVARGASRAQVMSTGTAESALVALLGTVLGAGGAWGVLQFLPGGDSQGGTVLLVAAATFAGVLLTLITISVAQARRLAGGQVTADRSGRARAATALATVVLVLGAAGLAWWQLDRAGSPLVTRDDGTLGTDLVAGAAPALLLAAAAVVAMALLGPVSRLVELGTKPFRSADAHLASAQVSRHLSVYAVPVVLTVLAVGATTLASLYSGTSAQLRDDLAEVAEGAALRADLVQPIATVAPGQLQTPPPELTDLPEIGAAALVWMDRNGRVGDIGVPVTLGDTTALAEVAHQPAGTVLVPDGLQTLLSPGTQNETSSATGAINIPAGVDELLVEVDVELAIDRFGTAYLEFLPRENELIREALAQEGIDADAFFPPDPELGEDATPEEQARQALAFQLELSSAPRPVNVSLLLRDTSTGMTQLVHGEEFSVNGPSFDFSDLDDITVIDSTSSATLSFSLPPGREHALEAVAVNFPIIDGHWTNLELFTHLDLGLRVVGDGQDLLDQAPAAWGTEQAMTPQRAEPHLQVAQEVGEPEFAVDVTAHSNGFETSSTDNNPYVPLVLDSSGSTWRITGPLTRTRADAGGATATISAGRSFTGYEPALPGQEGPEEDADPAAGVPLPPTDQPGADESSAARVPLAVTEATAQAANLSVGDEFELTVSGMRLPATLTAVVPAVPGSTSPLGALADSRALAAAAAHAEGGLNWPTQVWAVPSDDSEQGIQAALTALSAQDGLRGAVGPGRTQVTDATSAARLVFWVASAGAVLLSLTGIAAVAATLVNARRPEVAVLRALGMPAGAQARSRALELAGVVLTAIVLGLCAGWFVGAAVVPELARSTTLPGQVTLPASPRLEIGPWAVLLGLGAAVVAGMLFVLGGRVRAQGLDRNYREEIR